jgi:hypothetical protein
MNEVVFTKRKKKDAIHYQKNKNKKGAVEKWEAAKPRPRL